MAQKNERRGRREQGRRREPLQDNYYYQVPIRNFEDISSYSSEKRRDSDKARMERGGRRPPKPYRARRRMSLGKKIAVVLSLLLVAGVGLFVYMFMGLRVHSLSRDVGADSSVSVDGVKNIAVFGLDSRDDENEGRSDVTMVLTLDSRTHKVKMASLMRDSYVYIEGYGYDKLAHAYAYGGPELAVRTLNQNYHLDIENYVTVNFVEMAKIVDAFGGVKLSVSEAERVEINNNLYYLSVESADADIQNSDYLNETGELLLNGKQAVSYARIRHLEGGDDIRAGRQQIVLQALIQQLKGKSKLAYPALVHNVVPMCETSLGYLDMMGLAPFLLTDFTMETLTVPGQEENAYGDFNENGAWVYLYDIEAAAAHISRFIYE